jgi:hypothetical protein
MGDIPALVLLKKHLALLPPGEVAQGDSLTALLAGCWDQFEAASATGMRALEPARMEAVRWAPPVLSFKIERHSAMTRGSTRAELQVWRIDVERNCATCVSSRGYPQLAQSAEPVKAAPIAGEIAEAIAAGRDDQRLSWEREGTVRVVLTEVFPSGSGYLRNIAGRRKQLRAALRRRTELCTPYLQN